MKIVYRAKDITEAEIIRGMLQAEGIDAHSSGFYLQGAIGDMAALDFAKVHVADEDYDRARALVKEYEGQDPDTVETRSEPDIAATTRPRKFLVTLVIAIVISILSYWVGV